MMQGQNKIVVFDVFGTLFSLDKPKHLIMDLFSAPPSTLNFWWANTTRAAMALTLNGEFKPFVSILEEELKLTILNELKPSSSPAINVESSEFQCHITTIMNSLKDLELKKGVKEALELWKSSNYKLICLSNGSHESTSNLLKNAGVEDMFDSILSCDSVKKFKPHPEVYALTKDITGEKWFVASHAWDILGSHKAGFKTVFCTDLELDYPSTIYPPPNLTVKHLRNAAEKMSIK